MEVFKDEEKDVCINNVCKNTEEFMKLISTI